MTDVTTLLAGIRALEQAANEGPWFAVRYYIGSGEDHSDPDAEIAKAGSKADAEFIAAARTDVPRLVRALEAVAGLHKPLDVFEYDDTNGVFKLDADGEQIPAGSFCQECSDPDVIQSIEDCEYDTSGGYGEVSWPCPTITAITTALGGGE